MKTPSPFVRLLSILTRVRPGSRLGPLGLMACLAVGLGLVLVYPSHAGPPLSFVEWHTDNQNGVDGLDAAHAITVSPDNRHVYVASDGDDAVAVFGRNNATGRLTFVEIHKNGLNSVEGLDEALSVVVSPDNQHVYVAARVSDAIAVFSRNPADGRLTFVERRQDGQDGVDGLNGAISVAASPDNRHIYVAGYDNDAVAVFGEEGQII